MMLNLRYGFLFSLRGPQLDAAQVPQAAYNHRELYYNSPTEGNLREILPYLILTNRLCCRNILVELLAATDFVE